MPTGKRKAINAYRYRKQKRNSQKDLEEESTENETVAAEATEEALQFDEDDSDEDEDPLVVADEMEPTREVLAQQFVDCFKRYKKACKKIQWRELYPKAWREKGWKNFPLEFWDVDISRALKVLMNLNEESKGRPFGYLPVMATASRGSIGAFLASSFCERINSIANLVLTDGNTLLSEEEINMLTTLKMNRKYLEFMRKNYGHMEEKHEQYKEARRVQD